MSVVQSIVPRGHRAPAVIYGLRERWAATMRATRLGLARRLARSGPQIVMKTPGQCMDLHGNFGKQWLFMTFPDFPASAGKCSTHTHAPKLCASISFANLRAQISRGSTARCSQGGAFSDARPLRKGVCELAQLSSLNKMDVTSDMLTTGCIYVGGSPLPSLLVFWDSPFWFDLFPEPYILGRHCSF